MAWSKDFREAYLARFPSRSEQFERDLFWRGLHRRGLLLSWVIYGLTARFFDLERRTIGHLGNSRSSEEFRAELDSYRLEYRRRGGVLRNVFGVRLSGTRLIRVLMELREHTE